MVVNTETKKLIKEFEGLRLKAYKCSAGKWTIGYGHTSAAGEPAVYEGMVITKREAERIFDRDIEQFASKIRPLFKVELTPNQFGACVSLAYNIGIGAFAKSSVLRFINNRKFEDAADAFLLWNKVTKDGKKVVEKGLTRRRAAEAALFKADEVIQHKEVVRIPDVPECKKMVTSTTNIATTVTAAAGVSAAVKEVVDNTTSIFSTGNLVTLCLILVVLAGAAWVIRERWNKARDWAI